MRAPRKALFFTLILLASFLQPVLAIDEVVDDYTDETRVAGKNQVVRNTTYDAMELEYVGGAIGLPGWDYRKLHNITGSVGNNVTNYQIMIGIDYGAGSDSGSVVYLDGECQTDFDDIRFTDSDGVTEIDYWLEQKVNGDSAIFWVERPSMLESPAVTSFYIYYGNSTVSSTSNGANTFLEFDDFSSDTKASYTRSPWRGNNGQVPKLTWNVAGYMEMTHIQGSLGAGSATLTGTSYGVGYSVDGKVKYTGGVNNEQIYMGIHGSTKDVRAGGTGYIGEPYDRYVRIQSGTGGVSTNEAFDWTYGLTSAWHQFYMSIAPTWLVLYVDLDLALNATYVVQSGSVGFSDYAGQIPAKTLFDDLRVRKYVYPEPTHGGWGPEEILGTGYFNSGHFYTTDILAGISYNATAVLFNTTIPGGDTITVEFSQDNSTWTLNDWEPIFGGYEAVDLRVLNYNITYFRFNFTDGGADSTPRLYQLRLIHEAPGGGETYITGSIGIFLIVLIIIIPIVYYAVKRR